MQKNFHKQLKKIVDDPAPHKIVAMKKMAEVFWEKMKDFEALKAMIVKNFNKIVK